MLVNRCYGTRLAFEEIKHYNCNGEAYSRSHTLEKAAVGLNSFFFCFFLLPAWVAVKQYIRNCNIFNVLCETITLSWH